MNRVCVCVTPVHMSICFQPGPFTTAVSTLSTPKRCPPSPNWIMLISLLDCGGVHSESELLQLSQCEVYHLHLYGEWIAEVIVWMQDQQLNIQALTQAADDGRGRAVSQATRATLNCKVPAAAINRCVVSLIPTKDEGTMAVQSSGAQSPSQLPMPMFGKVHYQNKPMQSISIGACQGQARLHSGVWHKALPAMQVVLQSVPCSAA